jgi:dipeptidyl-peptidase-4
VIPAGVDGDRAFPEQVARTRGFQLGHPRTVTPSAERVVFLRSKAGDDPVTCLWVLDLATGEEGCVFDPRDHLPPAQASSGVLTAAERARRERARELALGVVAYATDEAATRAVFAESERLFLADLVTGGVEELAVPGSPYDPRLSLDGSRVAYVVDGALHVQDVHGAGRVLASDDDPDVAWGVAEFAAAEEMGRLRGHWFSPDGARLAAARVDERHVAVWWISDPTDPASEPRAVRYPAAGTANALVSLHLFDVTTGTSLEVEWDREGFEYLADVDWSAGAPLTIRVQSRDQRVARLFEVDEATGATTLLNEQTDPAWVELVDGVPRRLADGRVADTVDAHDRRRLTVGGDIVTTPALHVRRIDGIDGDAVWFSAAGSDPTETHLYRVVAGSPAERITEQPGVHEAAVADGIAAVRSLDADTIAPRTWIRRTDGSTIDIASMAEKPVVEPRPIFSTLGERELRSVLVLPGGREPGDAVPVLLSPYGGPHLQLAINHRGWFVGAQWFADRLGAAVLVIDGRGTPGRGVAWEKAVHLDFSVTLEDQVDGLQAAAKEWPFLDLDRVAIRGWSFGGELSAMAVCTRPDVFHAGVAGAPVTDQRLYDTHYTERYLGHPEREPEAYRRSSPLTFAADLRRPLLLIHGFSDDNVIVGHTVQMSAALFAAGIPHELVLIPNASHMAGTGDVVVARYLIELDFLRRSLGLMPPE